jgi:hypothetical protein
VAHTALGQPGPRKLAPLLAIIPRIAAPARGIGERSFTTPSEISNQQIVEGIKRIHIRELDDENAIRLPMATLRHFVG